MSKDQAVENTDVEIWRKPLPKGESEGMSYYQPSISVTKQGLIQIHVGGLVIGLPVEEWHNLAKEYHQPTTPNQKQSEIELDEKRLRKILKLWAKRHGAPDTWGPKPLLVKWLMAWKKEGKMP